MTTDEQERVRFVARAWFDAGWGSLGARVLRWGLIVGLGYLVWRSHAIVVTLILAAILASAISVPVNALCRLPWLKPLDPHTRKASVTIVMLLLVIASLVGLVFAVAHPFQNEFAELQKNLPAYQKQIESQWEKMQLWYETQAPPFLHNLFDKKPGAAPAPSSGPDVMQPIYGYAMRVLGSTASWVGHIVEMILLPVLAFYFVVDGKSLRNEFLRFLPENRQRTALAILHESAGIMRSYLLAQFILASVAGVVVGGLLGFAHIKYAFMLAVVAGVTRAVPVIGPLLGGIPLGILVFIQCAQSGNYATLIVILTIFTIMHFAESKFLTPIILGDRLHLHPVIVIVSLLIAGEFFGLMGMFLAAPVTALVRVLLMHCYVYPRRKDWLAQPPRDRRAKLPASRLTRALRPSLLARHAPKTDESRMSETISVPIASDSISNIADA